MDDFREWLSDNLRYFMLGGAILLIAAVLFFSIRACTSGKKKSADSGQQTAQGDASSSGNGETNDEKEEDTNPLEKNNADITAVVKQYYESLGEKDTDTLKTLTVDFIPSDEARIANARYIQRYEVKDVYSKKGLDDTSYVVYVSFEYYCEGIDTAVPALSQMYIVTDESGAYKIAAASEDDGEISAYMSECMNDEDVKELYAEVKAAYEAAQKSDPELAAFLEGLGEDASSSTAAENGTMLKSTGNSNVREEPDSEAEIIGSLDEGQEVEKLGQEGDWIQIEYEGQTGYVYSSLLE